MIGSRSGVEMTELEAKRRLVMRLKGFSSTLSNRDLCSASKFFN